MLVERMERKKSRTVGTPPSSPGEQSPLRVGGLGLGPELGWGRRVENRLPRSILRKGQNIPMSELTKLGQQGNGMVVRGVRVLLMEESLFGDTGVEGLVVRRPHRPAGEHGLAAIVPPPQTLLKT